MTTSRNDNDFLAWIAVAFFVHSPPQYNFYTIHASVYPFFCSHFFLRYEESLFISTQLIDATFAQHLDVLRATKPRRLSSASLRQWRR